MAYVNEANGRTWFTVQKMTILKAAVAEQNCTIFEDLCLLMYKS